MGAGGITIDHTTYITYFNFDIALVWTNLVLTKPNFSPQTAKVLPNNNATQNMLVHALTLVLL